MPLPKKFQASDSIVEGKQFITDATGFEIHKEVKTSKQVILFTAKEYQEKNSKFPEQLKLLLHEFHDITGEELPTDLSPMRSRQHQIDLVPSSKHPNLPHHRMSTKEHEIFQGIVNELF